MTAMSIRHIPNKNRLLSTLPPHGSIRVYLPHLELVSMQAGEVFCEPCGQLPHVYFPMSAIMSCITSWEIPQRWKSQGGY